MDVARDINPGRRGIGRRWDRVRNIEDAGGGDGVGIVAAARRVGDNRPHGTAVETGRDIDPVVTRAAAAPVLSDIDLAGRGPNVDEVTQVADPRRGGGIRCAVGQGIAKAVGTAKDRRFADVKPGHAFVGRCEDSPDR